MVRTPILAALGGLVIAGLFLALLLVPRGVCGADGTYVQLRKAQANDSRVIVNITSGDLNNSPIVLQMLDTFVSMRIDRNASWSGNTSMSYEVNLTNFQAIRGFFDSRSTHGSETVFRYQGVTFRAELDQVVC